METFDHRDLDPYRIPIRLALVLFLFSVVLHFSILFFAAKNKSDADLVKVEPQRVAVDLRYRPVLDTLQETAKEKPKDAKFESSRNLQAEEDTSPEKAPTSWTQQAGRDKDTKAASAKKSRPAKKIMSFRQEDLIAEGEIQRETLRGLGDEVNSSGFYEKLKKGAELKIAALESDYGQYVTRMKRKIAQQWSPQRTITAKMYSLSEVRVDIAVVLDSQGEIVDLRITNGSFFPEYDAETKRAIRDAGPFPNPPKSLLQDQFVYMPWSFSVIMNQAGSFHVE